MTKEIDIERLLACMKNEGRRLRKEICALSDSPFDYQRNINEINKLEGARLALLTLRDDIEDGVYDRE